MHPTGDVGRDETQIGAGAPDDSRDDPGLRLDRRPRWRVRVRTESWLQRMRHTPDDVLGWKWTSYDHPDDRDRVVPKWREAIVTGHPLDLEMRGRDAKGSTDGC